MTGELHKRIEEATKIMAQAAISTKDCAAAMRKTAKAMISFKDCIPILKKNRNTIFKSGD